MVNKWINFIQFQLFPPTCMLCGAPGLPGLDICFECQSELSYNRSCCSRCAVPLPSPSVEICGACLKSPPKFDSCFSPFVYEGYVADLVSRLKFHSQLQSARLLAHLMMQEIEEQEVDLPDLMLPVPLHPSRIRERGYNQAVELGRYLSKGLKIKMDRFSCVRKRSTEAQTSLPRKKRINNVRGAFALPKEISADHVALLDDVVTTGSTAGELAALLKQSGVKRVDVWTIARTS